MFRFTEAPLAEIAETLFDGQNQALLRAMIEDLAEGVIVTDAAGRWLCHTGVANVLLANSAPRAAPSSPRVFHDDERTPFALEQLPLPRALLGEERPAASLFIRPTPESNGRHLTVQARAVRDTRGHPLGVIALVHDTTAQRQAEAVRRSTEERFRLLVEIAQEGIWTIDLESRTTYVNDYMARMLGHSAQEMLGKHLFDFMDEEGREIATRLLERRRNGYTDIHDFKFVRKDGQPLWAMLSTSPIQDETGRYVGALATISDVTQRRAAEEQVRILNIELERRIAERTAQLEFSNHELEAFAYSVAHDLRAPLRSISSFSQALAEDCAPLLDTAGLDYLRRIQAASQRMAELIEGILTLSRVNRSALAQRPCNLSAMASDIMANLQAESPGRTVRFTCAGGLWVQGDLQLLRQVLENLLGNAWKFTREREQAEITFAALTEPGAPGAVYFVKDNGAGFDMAYQGKLFGVFQRLHTQQEFEGTGIGLASVQRAIRRHEGHVWAEGKVGAGATFFFTLHQDMPRK